MNQVGDEAEPCSECGYNIKPHGVHVSWCSQKQKQDKEILSGSVEGTLVGDEAGATCEVRLPCCDGCTDALHAWEGNTHVAQRGPQVAHPTPEPSRDNAFEYKLGYVRAMLLKQIEVTKSEGSDKYGYVQWVIAAIDEYRAAIQKPEPSQDSYDHREIFEKFFRELWAVIVDPLEEPPSFTEGMQTLLVIAAEHRELMAAIQKPEPPEQQRDALVEAVARAICKEWEQCDGCPGRRCANTVNEDDSHDDELDRLARVAIKAVEEFHRGK